MTARRLRSYVAKDRLELAGGRKNAKSGQDGKCASGDGLQMSGHFTNAWPCGPVPILIYASLCDHCNYVLKATGPRWPCMATYGAVHQRADNHERAFPFPRILGNGNRGPCPVAKW